SLVQEVRGLVERVGPGQVVVEVPSGQAGSATRRRAAAGSLGVMGLAQGAVWATCLALLPGGTVGVDERAWTRGFGVTAKDRRQYRVASLYPSQYRPDADPGGDVSDAIALGLWWL